jgi:hypothetical protein
MPSKEPGDSPPTSAAPDRHAVLRQLERLLEHIAFRNSVRCTKLLRYLVERTLDDPAFQPKERTLAIEVFGRSPDYDTAADPIVRTTANEIRKRLGSYFHDTGGETEVLIELRSGNYRPLFRAAPARTATAQAQESLADGLPPASRSRRRRVYLAGGCLVAAVLVGTLALALAPRLFPSNAERFWRPFLNSPQRILVCTPNPDLLSEPQAATDGAGSPTKRPVAPALTPMIPISDSKAVWRILSVLGPREKNAVVRTSDRVLASDLLTGPAIIIGGRNNAWSSQLTSRLRFQIIGDGATHDLQIVDRWSAAERKWSIGARGDAKDSGRTYALISKVTDPLSHYPALNIAGLGTYATAAAGEFIAQPRYLNGLGDALKGCDSNMQLVLSAELLNGNLSAPKVDAIHCW